MNAALINQTDIRGIDMAINKFSVTQEEIQSTFHYDPSVGVFIYKDRKDVSPNVNSKSKGKPAGAVRSDKGGHKYWNIMVRGKLIGAHRLAWLYVHGYLPPHDIDHIDGNGLNNKLANLREATRSQNLMNTKKVRSRAGFRGVSLSANKGLAKPYRARITAHGKNIWLGRHKTAEEAHEVFIKEAKKHYGEFVPGR